MRVDDFSALHAIPKKRVEEFLSAHSEYRSDDGIDYRKVIARYELHKRIYNFATEYIYYALIEIFGSEYALARRLAMDGHYTMQRWHQYLKRELFLPPPDNLLSGCRIPRTLIIFARLGSKYLYLYAKEAANEKKNFEPDAAQGD